jgi:hypothetical protein
MIRITTCSQEENAAATEIKLRPDEVAEIEQAVPEHECQATAARCKP